MSNVRKGPSSKGIPTILVDDDMLPPKVPPNTIESQTKMAKGKAGMNWTHPQLGPEQHYVDSEEGGKSMPSAEGDEKREPGMAQGGGKKSPRHRSTSGAPGHGLVGN